MIEEYERTKTESQGPLRDEKSQPDQEWGSPMVQEFAEQLEKSNREEAARIAAWEKGKKGDEDAPGD